MSSFIAVQVSGKNFVVATWIFFMRQNPRKTIKKSDCKPASGMNLSFSEGLDIIKMNRVMSSENTRLEARNMQKLMGEKKKQQAIKK